MDNEGGLSVTYPFRLGPVAGVQYADDRADPYGVNTKAGRIFVSCHT